MFFQSDKGFGSPVVCQDVSGSWTLEGVSYRRSECFWGQFITDVMRIRDFVTAIQEVTGKFKKKKLKSTLQDRHQKWKDRAEKTVLKLTRINQCLLQHYFMHLNQ